MPHFAFLMLPEPGHILPTVRTAMRLQARGHIVSYVSLPHLEPYFRKHGFRFSPVMSDVFAWPSTDDILRTPSGVLAGRDLRAHVTSPEGLYELLIPPLSELSYDILLCDSSLLLSLPFRLYSHLSKPTIAVSVFLPDDPQEDLRIPQMIMCPVEFEIPAAAARLLATGRSTFVEASVCQDREPVDFCWTRVSQERHLVYCSLGTQVSRYASAPSVLRSVVSAVADLPSHQLVLCVPNAPDILKDLPTYSTIIVVHPAPQLSLLACCQVFITHGGIGGLKESIMAGVPSLVIPFDFDQPKNAARVEYHNLGRTCLPHECTPTRIQRMLQGINSDSGIRESISRMRAAFWKRESAASSVTCLETLATELLS
jgi:UDP:flavonoid glycosyltransferase YjiC (YdhE family)